LQLLAIHNSFIIKEGDNMKKVLAIFIAAMCVLSLAACSGANSDSAAPRDASGGSLMERNMSVTETNEVHYGFDNVLADFEQAGNAAELPAEQARMIIRNASMMIEAENAVELFKNLNEFNRALGGFEFSSQTQHFDTYTSVEAVLKVPPHKLDEFMSFAGENGRIIRSSTTSDDITDQFFDMSTRVESKRRSLEAYYALLEVAGTITEITSLQRTIDSIIEEIEAFEGRMRVLANLAEMATVELYISQRYDPVLEERREIDWNALTLGDMGYFIRNGFISVLNFITTIFQWAFIALIVTSPLWIAPAVILIVLWRKKKKKRS
jgi:hypothetical protein